jgi:DNA polymerase III alpha subunit
MNWINLSELKGDLKSMSDEDLIFHCEVIKLSKRASKKGNVFGILEVKNNYSQAKLFLFREDFLKFQRFGSRGGQLLIKGRAQKQKFSENYGFKIIEIQDLF